MDDSTGSAVLAASAALVALWERVTRAEERDLETAEQTMRDGVLTIGAQVPEAVVASRGTGKIEARLACRQAVLRSLSLPRNLSLGPSFSPKRSAVLDSRLVSDHSREPPGPAAPSAPRRSAGHRANHWLLQVTRRRHWHTSSPMPSPMPPPAWTATSTRSSPSPSPPSSAPSLASTCRCAPRTKRPTGSMISPRSAPA